MPASIDPSGAIARAVSEYRRDGDVAALLASLSAAADAADSPEAIAEAAEPFRAMPEVAGPLYERIVEQRPDDARALVILANAYWLAGRGPDVVGALASRALAADPANRGAWHLWALTESNVRQRVTRWQQVVRRFPDDELARANLADNAASLAGAEGDRAALRLAIQTYESLLPTATHAPQREALLTAIRTLGSWRL
jgi:hypothetical protein